MNEDEDTPQSGWSTAVSTADLARQEAVIADPVRLRMTLGEPNGETEDVSDPMPRSVAHEIEAILIPFANLRWHPADRTFGTGLYAGFEIRRTEVVAA